MLEAVGDDAQYPQRCAALSGWPLDLRRGPAHPWSRRCHSRSLADGRSRRTHPQPLSRAGPSIDLGRSWPHPKRLAHLPIDARQKLVLRGSVFCSFGWLYRSTPSATRFEWLVVTNQLGLTRKRPKLKGRSGVVSGQPVENGGFSTGPPYLGGCAVPADYCWDFTKSRAASAIVLVRCVTFMGGISVVSPVVAAALSIDGPAGRCGPPGRPVSPGPRPSARRAAPLHCGSGPFRRHLNRLPSLMCLICRSSCSWVSHSSRPIQYV